MIDIESTAYKEIQEAMLLERREYVERQEKRNLNRNVLSESERQNIDAAFAGLFNQIVNQKSEDVATLGQLLDKGAKTTCFVDHELTNETNFANALRDWIGEVNLADKHPAIATAFNLCIEAGEAFITNRQYVGNGGANATWLLLDYFTGWVAGCRISSERDQFAEHLLIKMAVVAGDHTKFWEEFFFAGCMLLLPRVKADNPQQQRIARFYLSCFLHASPELMQAFLFDVRSWESNITMVCKAFFAVEFVARDVLQYADAAKGIFKYISIPKGEYRSFQDDLRSILGTFLKSKTSRKQLERHLKSSSWLRSQFFQMPESLFKLAREKSIIGVFLKKDAERLRKIRNKQGDDLLLVLCKAQGRTEKVAKLLLEAGFRPDIKNKDGKTALDIAVLRKQKPLVALLSKGSLC